MPPYKLDIERANGAEIRQVGVDGGGPSMSHEANLRRLSDIAARGWNEEVGTIDSRTADVRDDEFMIVRVVDGMPRGLPETAGASLRRVVAEAAASPAGTGDIRVGYSGPREEIDTDIILRPCTFEPADLVIGGAGQRRLFVDLLSKAQQRVIIHSTFLDAKRFEGLMDPIRAACLRGVSFELLWGAERDEATEERSAKAAAAIARMVREDPVTRGRFHVQTRSTGSHAKLVFLDTKDGWLAAVKRVMYGTVATSTEKCFAYAVAEHLNCVTLDAWPGQARLAQLLGFKSVKTIQRAARALEQLLILEVKCCGRALFRYAPVFLPADEDENVPPAGQIAPATRDADVHESLLLIHIKSTPMKGESDERNVQHDELGYRRRERGAIEFKVAGMLGSDGMEILCRLGTVDDAIVERLCRAYVKGALAERELIAAKLAAEQLR